MSRFILIATLALAGAAHAQIPQPSQGDGGLLFAAWDDERSYTFYLGLNFSDFQENTVDQVYALPMIEGFFPVPEEVTWSITAADGDGDVLFGGAAFFASGEVTNLTSGAGVLAATGAIDNYISDTNRACGENPVCFATSADVHYAGRDSFGEDLGFSGGVSLGGQIGEFLIFTFVEQEAFNPDGQAPRRLTAFQWAFDGTTLTYGGPSCLDFDGRDDGITEQLLGEVRRNATWFNWDGAGSSAPMVGFDREAQAIFLCSDDECPLGPENPQNWRFVVTGSSYVLQLLRPGNVVNVRQGTFVRRVGVCEMPMFPTGDLSVDPMAVYDPYWASGQR